MSPSVSVVSASVALLLALLSPCPRSPLVAGLNQDDVSRLQALGVSSLFSADEVASMQAKRVRREVRSLAHSEWVKIGAAMNVMKSTGHAEGRALYGAGFWSYDRLVCFHSSVSYAAVGDLNHGGPHFPIYHRAYTLLFERSLLAVDPTIEAVPYWDFRLDAADPEGSEVFTDRYFGSLLGDAESGYAIKDGPFAYWAIGEVGEDGADELGCAETGVHNIWGQMRSPMNLEKSGYVTRIGGYMCGEENSRGVGADEDWEACLDTSVYGDYYSFGACYETTFHTYAHEFVGGTRPYDNGALLKDDQSDQDEDEEEEEEEEEEATEEEEEVTEDSVDSDISGEYDDSCISWSDKFTVEETEHVITQWFAQAEFGCLDCSMACDLDDDSEGCEGCSLSSEDGACTVTVFGEEYTEDFNVLDAGGVAEDEEGSKSEYVWGDFADRISSPNEPFFWFHHTNLDRYTFTWQLANHEKRGSYWDYPESGWEYGINLGDVAGGGTWGFAYQDLFDGCVDDDEDSAQYCERQLTYQDLFDWTQLTNVDYMYDDIIQAIAGDGEDGGDAYAQAAAAGTGNEESWKVKVSNGVSDQDDTGSIETSLIVLVIGLATILAVLLIVKYVVPMCAVIVGTAKARLRERRQQAETDRLGKSGTACDRNTYISKGARACEPDRVLISNAGAIRNYGTSAEHGEEEDDVLIF